MTDDEQQQGEGARLIGSWVDEPPDTLGGVWPSPHEELSKTPEGKRVLRHVQKAVTDRNDEVEPARWELAMLGLIPDPYPPTLGRDPVTRAVRSTKKEKQS